MTRIGNSLFLDVKRYVREYINVWLTRTARAETNPDIAIFELNYVCIRLTL